MNKKILMMILLITYVTICFADEKALEIARKNHQLKKPQTSSMSGKMVLINKQGKSRVREMQMYNRETGEGTDSFIKFLSPADVADVKFLTIGYDNADDQQRLYLPALGKARRISSSKKGGSFLGSDFNYFDMEEHSLSDFSYQYLGEGKFKDKNCFILKNIPKDKDTPYSSLKTWISKDNYYTYKIECYDKQGRLEKTIFMEEVKEIKDCLIAVKMLAQDHLSGTKTLLLFNDVKININIDEKVFSIQNLER